MKKLLLTIFLIILFAGVSQAIVIDDFSQDRDFSVGYGIAPPVILTDSRTGTSEHIIGGRCDIIFDKRAGSTSNPSLGYSIGGTYDNIYYPPCASYNSFFNSRALWKMEYGKNNDLNADLLSGDGTKFEIEIQGDLYGGGAKTLCSNPDPVNGCPRPVPCTITLISGKGTPQSATASVTQNLITMNGEDPYINTFNYSAFTGINFSDIDYIKVEMSMLTVTQDAVDYCINWIKTDNVPPPTLVELSSFTAAPGNGQVTLKWATATEIDNAGFNIYRAEEEDGEYVQINEDLIPAQGSATEGAAYELIDTSVQNGNTYYYELKDIELNGTVTMHGPVSATPIEQPIKVSLDIKPGSCPNPIGFADNNGGVPFAIMGTVSGFDMMGTVEDFDVTQIDPASIRITRDGVDAEVAPIRWTYEDVATPFEGELCNCHWLKGDGIMDLSMKAYTNDLVDVLKLKEVAGETIPLTITGKLKEEFGGTPIEGKDCVRILKAVLKGIK